MNVVILYTKYEDRVLDIKGNRAVCLCASSLRSLSLWEVARQGL